MPTILIVDDRPTNRELFVTLLGYAGYRMLEASDGEMGLAIARAEHPDLIIADIVMPKMDGYEFARQVRADPSINNTQIIFVTASYIIEEARNLAKACGVSIVLGKPIEPQSFLITVNEALMTGQGPIINPTTENFHQEHLQLLTNTLAKKVEALEAEIAERKQIETALLASERKYRSLFEDSPISIWEEDFSLVKQYIDVLRQNGVHDIRSHFASHLEEVQKCLSMVRVLAVNKAALQMYEAQSPEEMLGNLEQLVHPDTINNFQNELTIIAEGKTFLQWEGLDRTLKDKSMYVSLTWSVAPGYEHDYSKVIILTVDITQRKEAEEAAQKYALELERRVEERTIELIHANHTKNIFLANMSHELRTPLNSILGLAESLLEQRRDPLSEYQQKLLTIIESSGHHLLDLINDVLDLSKIEAGRFDYFPQDIDVSTLCKSSLEFVREQALRKSISLVYEEDDPGLRIHADPRRMKQIFVNLLNNAVKFTPEKGSVLFQVRTNAEQGYVQFTVADNGIGISIKDLKKLFQPFVQVDSALNRQYEGTGLGLALVQKLVDMHGGSVHVESEVGKGSQFTVNIPWVQKEFTEISRESLTPDDSVISHSTLDESHSEHLVLLAEDNEANIFTVSEYLEFHGFKVVNAQDGLKAIQTAEEVNPDIILMDIQMPGMDGLEAIRRLRANPRFDNTPIIALTALAMPGDLEQCLEAGADEYMSKPASMKALLKSINTLLQQRKGKTNQ